MSEQEKHELALEIAEHVMQQIHSSHSTVCPLGMTTENVKMVQRTARFFFWAGAMAAASLIASFAAGFGYVLWRGFQAAVGEGQLK